MSDFTKKLMFCHYQKVVLNLRAQKGDIFMKIQITSENMELTDSLKIMIEDKLGQDLDKYLASFEEDLKIADVVIEYNKNWGFRATFNIFLPGKEHIYAEAKSVDPKEDAEHVIVRLREELEPQFLKYRQKIKHHK